MRFDHDDEEKEEETEAAIVKSNKIFKFLNFAAIKIRERGHAVTHYNYAVILAFYSNLKGYFYLRLWSADASGAFLAGPGRLGLPKV